MKTGYPFLAAAALAGTGLPAAAAAQDTPYDLRDMVYARAGQAEAELQRRGYVAVRSETGSDRIWTNWWNADRRQCVSIVTRNGRYDSIVTAPAADCRGGNRPGRPDRPGWGGGPNWPGGRPISLGLVCFGEGQKPGAANRWGWQWNWDSGRYDFGNRTQLTTQQFDASVMIQLWDGGGRIRLPRALIPPIHSGGSTRDGWWDLYDVSQDRGQIRATYRLNGPNRPRVTIDRRSGRIRIQGIYNYGFNGSCDTIDGARHQRF
ncbi:hypothetical protein [Sphingomonas sp.]|uniref:hypothetical protein n=1 Tax=Sphingomonas sp. TaxID=28214 RepID=UPI002ED956AC